MDIKGIFTDKAYATYDSQLEKEVRAGEMPNHIAIIMDGNRAMIAFCFQVLAHLDACV